MKRPPGITPPPASPPPPPTPPPPSEKRAPRTPKAKPVSRRPAAPATDAQATEPIERLPVSLETGAVMLPERTGAAAETDRFERLEGRDRRVAPRRPERPGARSALAKRELRRATRTRRRYERAESKRFTQRSRRRRLAWMVAGASLVGLVIVVLLAAYSPLLAVRSIAVEGATRLDAAAVTSALDDQVGRPLALVDYGAIERELAAFPYIESYSVEARPPDTLAVRVVERRPVAQVQTATGFDLIDAAGVTVQQWPDRITGFPVLDLTGTEIGSPGFEAAASVLMSLPDDLLASIDRISGTTPDSVTFVFGGVGQSVVWGSPEESDLKARLLTRLIATQDPNLPVQYDVSSPQSPVVR